MISTFLALEPMVRGIAWWNAPTANLHRLLHVDTTWLLVSVLGILGVATLVEGVGLGLRRTWLTNLAILWGATATMSSSAAMVPALAAGRSLWWALALAFALALLVALRRQPQGAVPIILSWCAGFCTYAVVILAFIILDPVRPGIVWIGELPGVANLRHLGFEAMAVALLASLLRPADASLRTVWLLRIAAICGWAVLFWSGGRGSFLAACVALAGTMVLCSSWTRQCRETALLAVMGFAIATLHTPPSIHFGAWRTVGLETLVAAAETPDVNEVTSGRWRIWQESVWVIADNPLLGIGEAHTPLRISSAEGFAQPHNLFLQGALAWGVLGGGAFVFAILYAFRRAVRRIKGAPISSPAAAGFAVMLAMIINSMLDGTLFHPRPVTLFLIGSCLALGAPRREAIALLSTKRP